MVQRLYLRCKMTRVHVLVRKTETKIDRWYSLALLFLSMPSIGVNVVKVLREQNGEPSALGGSTGPG